MNTKIKVDSKEKENEKDYEIEVLSIDRSLQNKYKKDLFFDMNENDRDGKISLVKIFCHNNFNIYMNIQL